MTSKVFAINANGSLFEPKKDDEISVRYVVSNTRPLLYTGEGPTTWAGISDTLSYFSQPNAPPPFLLINRISLDTSRLRWADWDTRGGDWTALHTYCTIVDTVTDTIDYISVGDTVIWGNYDYFNSMPKNQPFFPDKFLLLFVHKKLITYVPAMQTMNLAHNYQTFATGDVTKGPGDVQHMYVSMGTSTNIYVQDIPTRQLPVVLRLFLNHQRYKKREYDDGENHEFTPFIWENWGFFMYYPNYSGEQSIRNSFLVTREPESYIELKNKYKTIYLEPIGDVKVITRKLMNLLLAYGKDKNIIFYLNGDWTEARGLNLARIICNSTAEADLTTHLSFCSCLGRKDVESKLREVTGLVSLKMECVSKACQEGDAFVYKPTTITACTAASGCIPSADYNYILPVLTNFNNTCNTPPPPLLLTPATPPAVSTPPAATTTTSPTASTPAASTPAASMPAASTPSTTTLPPPVSTPSPSTLPASTPPAVITPPPASTPSVITLPTTTSDNMPVIIGASVGAIIGLALIIALIVVLVKRRRNQTSQDK